MNISYNWLKRFIDFSADPHTLAGILTSLGLECDTVEEIESIRGGLRGVVVGKVLTCVDHPDSDHLHVTTVDLGGPEPVQIVCGAPNVAAGQTVVVATVGTVLYDGDKEIKIKKSKIRGVESSGMICAEDELGLGTDHAGIMVLPDGPVPGTPAAEFFNISSDWRLEVELTPNRVDAASHLGVARDLKAWLTRMAYDAAPGSVMPELRMPDASSFSVDRAEGAATVQVDDTEGCPRYSGVTIRGVKVTQSPEWLRKLLEAAGQRPVNNIVDITNFILLGIGQPLHCFDLSRVEGERIVVRTCPAGTPFTTLDGVEHKLHEADLMICDASKPLCIAGVFGGLDSGVTEATTDVFIESAWFNPTRIRRAARRHGLSTDASFRYERGTDPLITTFAARLAAVLIRGIAGGEICGDVVDIYPHPVTPARIDFPTDYCDSLVGKVIPDELKTLILRSLEIDVQPGADPRHLTLTVPPYRVDVTRPCDIVEEILRVYGYNNIEIPQATRATLSRRALTDDSIALENIIGGSLTAAGFCEILNNSLTAASYYETSERWPAAGAVRLMNPLSGDLSLMRRTLLFGGLESIAHNINRKAADLRLYEFGNVYDFNPAAPSTTEKPLAPYTERRTLGLWLTGNAVDPSWDTVARQADVFLLKGIVEGIFRRLGIDLRAVEMTQDSDSVFQARLTLRSKSGLHYGELGILRNSLLRNFDISQSVCYAELEWAPLVKSALRAHTEYTPLARTMPVRRDLALLLDTAVSFADVERTVRRSAGKLLRDVRLFDVYEGKNLPEGKKSYAVALTLQDDEKTLTDKQIDSVMGKTIEALRRNLGAELR